ncbi:transglutaminase [Nocardioides sp. OK12]|uniref:transglutaminase family protein n=1 Tax=Nocardioides sp. OK12 TaxID=2758661 RepID=UPI0021C4B052|nr:DUF3488 and transglutaminase-like domain-containing protein [Nocardioides sp. OK12]GHJ58177.1 transglutaminase [Nocardioides sp. OK12]
MTSRTRSSLGAGLTLSTVAALTTWICILSWRGFTDAPSLFLSPLLGLALLVAAVGAVGRWSRLGALSVLLLQLLSGAMALSWVVVGSPLPVGATWDALLVALADAREGAVVYASPVPTAEAAVEPLLLAGGLACLVLVDLLACGLRRVPLAGLPLLAVYSVPVSLLATDLTWWVFALSALGFVAMLYLQESEQVARWGRSLGNDDLTAPLAEPSGLGVHTATVRVHALAVGGVATALAVVVPLAVPTLDVHLLDIGRGPGGDTEISVDNPMTDLVRDLNRPEDTPLLAVRSEQVEPEYLRISVLNRFSENEWSPGDREIPLENRPDGEMPSLTGVSQSVPRRTLDYSIEAYETFSSRWLPTFAPVSRVEAEGDWRYDESTMDFLAGDADLDLTGTRWSMTGVDLDLSAQELADAPSSVGMVSASYTDLPDDMPPLIRQLANQVTASAPTRFQKAVALQDWFRQEFEYSLRNVPPGNGTDELEEFLSTEGDYARTGYCEQFASAMAVMARQLGIPARVAVGFLTPQRIADGVYEYSSDDLHAWPELFIAGSGWVRFEPTPPARAGAVPSYTREAVDLEQPEPSGPSGRAEDQLPDRNGEPSAAPEEELDPETGAAAGSTDGGFPWGTLLGVLLGALALVGLALAPGALRRRRREHRLAAGPEEIWDELRDTARDLGLPYAGGRSPRETGAGLVGHLGSPLDDRLRPGHGAGQAPEAVASLHRLVADLERLRYAPAGAADPAHRHDDGLRVVQALFDGTTPRARRRATWLPRTLLRPTRRTSAAAGPETESLGYRGGVVDHVG